MRNTVEVSLPKPNQPFSWAVKKNGLMFTVHAAVDQEGRIRGENITDQATLTFENLKRTVEAGGATLDDVAQVLIYMKDAAHMSSIDDVYRQYFREPFPSRASVVVKDFVHPEMLIEVVVYVTVDQ